MSTSTTHYLNPDFDPGLRPRPRQIDHPKLQRQICELSVQAWLAAGRGDAALCRAEVPPEFLEYLAACGLDVPRLLAHPNIDPETRLRPFGWSAEAMKLNRRHRHPDRHPSLTTIRRVNSRSFGLELEREIAPESPLGSHVESVAQLEAFLSEAPAGEWILKAEHGHSALANRRLREPALTAADRSFVDRRLAEDDLLIVEPWLDRQQDWSVVFEVPFERSSLRIHETFGTRDGALIGALFEHDAPAPDEWIERLAATAERVAARLEQEHYFGPVCVDAFSWNDDGKTRLRPLVDLNCRRAMSDGAHRLWGRLGARRTLYYRFFDRGKLALPEELPQLLHAMGAQRYDPSTRRGILLAAPLRLGPAEEAWATRKPAVILVADDRSGVFELERAFRERFEV